jgi:hypothetical protein
MLGADTVLNRAITFRNGSLRVMQMATGAQRGFVDGKGSGYATASAVSVQV